MFIGSTECLTNALGLPNNPIKANGGREWKRISVFYGATLHTIHSNVNNYVRLFSVFVRWFCNL